jgi:hypothetical protein
MTKFSEAALRVGDSNRVRAIRAEEAGRLDREFAPIMRKAQANLDATLRPVKQGEMRVALA